MKHREGFTIVEAVMAVLVVGILMVVAINAAAAMRTSVNIVSDRGRAQILAQDLMQETLQHPYWDPVARSGMGPSAGEAGTGNRSLFNDVDDYLGWTASPPQYRDGTVMANLSGWRRTVDVKWIKRADLTQTDTAESGVKRITVTVSRNGRKLAELVAIRTLGWPGTLGDQIVY